MSYYSKDESLRNLLSGLKGCTGVYYVEVSEALRSFLKERVVKSVLDEELIKEMNTLAVALNVAEKGLSKLIAGIEIRLKAQ